MKILLSGKPGAGKTTVLDQFIKNLREPATWMLTREVLNDTGDRVGFASTTSSGTAKLISHKTEISSDIVVGTNHIDLHALREVLSDVLAAKNEKHHLIILDEIGPIQLANPDFLDKFDHLNKDSNDMIASIHSTEAKLEEYRNSQDAIHIYVTPANRAMLPTILRLIVEGRSEYNKLATSQKLLVNRLVETYLKHSQILQLEKLMKNTIPYVNGAKIIPNDNSTWTVAGYHGQHEVTKRDTYDCTCDLYLGRRKYAEKQGECSHIQAVKIFNA